MNIAGELMDLVAAGLIEDAVDPVATSEQIMDAYRGLWAELTRTDKLNVGERWRIDERIRRLNGLGFDVEEISLLATPDGTQLVLQPKVVDAGHHQRRLLRLTGLDVEEHQARRLLNDIDAFRASRHPEADEDLAAALWVEEIFRRITRAIPQELQGKLEPAQIVHEVLEHRWYISERRGANVPLAETVASYVEGVLRHRRDEAAIMLDPQPRTLRDHGPARSGLSGTATGSGRTAEPRPATGRSTPGRAKRAAASPAPSRTTTAPPALAPSPPRRSAVMLPPTTASGRGVPPTRSSGSSSPLNGAREATTSTDPDACSRTKASTSPSACSQRMPPSVSAGCVRRIRASSAYERTEVGQHARRVVPRHRSPRVLPVPALQPELVAHEHQRDSGQRELQHHPDRLPAGHHGVGGPSRCRGC